MLRKSCAASLALAGIVSLAAGPAALADGTTGSLKDASAPVEEYVWDGFYVGVGIGAGSFDHSVDVNASKAKKLEKRQKECKEYSGGEFPVCTLWDWGDWNTLFEKEVSKHAAFGDDEWNVFGTVQVGYDRLFHQHLLIGAFVDFDFYQDSGHSFSEPWVKIYDGWEKEIGSISGDIELDHMWSIGGRLGYLITPRILLYGVGGYSEASLDGVVDVTFKNYWGDPTVLSLTAPDELQGWFIGGGGELKLQKNVSLKFEYRFTDLDGDNDSASLTKVKHWGDLYKEYRLTKTFNADADFDADIHSVRAVLVLKFDRDEPAPVPLK